jgi:hypothetical protein
MSVQIDARHPEKKRLKTGREEGSKNNHTLDAPSFSPYRSAASIRPRGRICSVAHSPFRPIAHSPARHGLGALHPSFSNAAKQSPA